MRLKKSSCLVPAALQSVLMLFFVGWSFLPEGSLTNAGLPLNYDLMPYLLILTIVFFIWCLYMWLFEFVKTRGSSTNHFGSALTVILIDIAIMGFLMPDRYAVPERTKRADCAANLRILMTAFAAYQEKFGVMPPVSNEPGFELLRSSGLIADSAVFICPGTALEPASPDSVLQSDQCGYLYFALKDRKTSIILMDKPGNHSGFHNEAHRKGVFGVKESPLPLPGKNTWKQKKD